MIEHKRKEDFDLGYFLTNSLSLQGQLPTKRSYPGTLKNPYLDLYHQDPIDVLGERFIRSVEFDENLIGTPVQEFYRSSSVFITGGTGFLGKLLIEKLLRSIPQIEHIYLLIRSKKGKTSKERFEELLNNRVYLRLKTERPQFYKKISFIEGDISLPGLGLGIKDRQTLQDKVHIIFNSAADVRFIEPLKSSITSNVSGTQRVLELAKEIKHLKCFLHVSTAFSQCVLRRVPEDVPQMSISYREIMDFINSKSDSEVELKKGKIMQGWPNSYTFSKAVCESMLVEEGKRLPLCIFRPAIVGVTYKEPVRGWTDNLNGPVGMCVAIALGVLHCFKLHTDLPTEVVPADYVVNCMIAAVWKTHTSRTENVPVFNYTATPDKVPTWKEANDAGLKYRDLWPYSDAIYYTTFFSTTSKHLDRLMHLILHTIPGKIIDIVCVRMGLKIRLSKIYDKISILKDPIEWFSGRTWEFDKENVQMLWRSMSKEDKSLFHFDVVDVDVVIQLLIGKLAVRYYYLKDQMETLPFANMKHKCLRWVHRFVQIAFGYATLKGLAWVAHYVPI